MSILALLSDHRGATQVTPFVRSPAPAEAASAHSTQRYTVSSGESPPLSRSFFDSSRLSRFALRSRPATGPNCPRPRPVCIVRPSDGFRADPVFSLAFLSASQRSTGTTERANEVHTIHACIIIYIYIYIRGGRKRERVFFFFSATVSVACRCRANVSDSPRVPRVSTRVRNIYEIHTVVRCALAYLTARVKKSGHLSVFETGRSE